MRNRKVIIAVISIILVLESVVLLFINKTEFSKIDYVKVNDIVMTAKENWDKDLDTILESKAKEYKMDFTIFNENEFVIMKTTEKSALSLKEAVEKRYVSTPIIINGDYKGSIVINSDYEKYTSFFKDDIKLITIVFTLIIILIVIVYDRYLNRTIIRPFIKLKKFAGSVAGGNLDIPLQMDKDNIFGAFTESFDIMREQLKTARENEMKAKKSKTELVASLSHDIKTPVASIKAMSELMTVKESDEKKRTKLYNIWNKANQIETLINNLLHSTLEELSELEVNCTMEDSNVIAEIIAQSDFEHKISEVNIPQCIISCDKIRLQQVIDNLISNSYKYADTKIDVNSFIEDGFLFIELRDYGIGVAEDEIEKIKVKFYRASNSRDKNGYGMGLYITDCLLHKMGGELSFSNAEPGLEAIVTIKLA